MSTYLTTERCECGGHLALDQSEEWLTSNPERKKGVCVECGEVQAVPKPDITEVESFKPFLSTQSERKEQIEAIQELITLLERVTKTKSLPQGGGIVIIDE